jgi:hypothetical protein
MIDRNLENFFDTRRSEHKNQKRKIPKGIRSDKI